MNITKLAIAKKMFGGGSGSLDAFWDDYQENGARYHWNYAFGNQGWDDKTYGTIKHPITKISYASGMFNNARITDTVYPLDFSNVAAQPTNVFSYCANLKTVRTLTVNENNTFSSWFQNCNSLENITFAGVIAKNGLSFQWSTKLSHESLVSIINCLEDKTEDTSGTAWVVTVGSTNYAKLTEEEIRIASQKGWNIV